MLSSRAFIVIGKLRRDLFFLSVLPPAFCMFGFMEKMDVVQQVSDLMKLRNEKRDEWLKQVIFGATTLLGLIISLHKDKSTTSTLHFVFGLAILLLSLGILSGTACLFSNINALHRLVGDRIKHLRKGTENQLGQIDVANPLRIFDMSRIVCYFSFFLSVPALAWYAILLDF